jgi:hypothetical protein
MSLFHKKVKKVTVSAPSAKSLSKKESGAKNTISQRTLSKLKPLADIYGTQVENVKDSQLNSMLEMSLDSQILQEDGKQEKKKLKKRKMIEESSEPSELSLKRRKNTLLNVSNGSETPQEEKSTLASDVTTLTPVRKELAPFQIRKLETMNKYDMASCMRIFGVAKESGRLYSFLVDEFNIMIEGSFRYLQNTLEEIAEKVYGEKKGKKWSAWRAKLNSLFVRNTYEEIIEEKKEEEEESTEEITQEDDVISQ